MPIPFSLSIDGATAAAAAKAPTAPLPPPSRAPADPSLPPSPPRRALQVVVDQARESYTAEVVIELQSDNPAQGEANLETLISTVQAWSPAPARGAKPGGGGRYNPY